MRKIVLILALSLAAGCASSNGAPAMRQTCEDTYDTVWVAAQAAVRRVGGAIVDSNRSSGTILGRLTSEVMGAEIDLHITLSRLPDHQPGTLQPVTVTVRATDPRVAEPSPGRVEDLRTLEERYLRLVGERAACGGPV